MLPIHHLSAIRPEPRTAHNLKKWSVAGDLPAIQTPHRSADESSPLQELFSVLDDLVSSLSGETQLNVRRNTVIQDVTHLCGSDNMPDILAHVSMAFKGV
ncbi:hypothetical protein NP493_662g01029 [Ridgeia piscesae]|uniref:Uncharacterized protein n=1 Tax=Ridgeia piscesae TaxID=27915 RepID=A0AAD9KTI8_RIDPI|nr:hypothetical protein NP493_662g01029 [Ridgeia piscesae]